MSSQYGREGGGGRGSTSARAPASLASWRASASSTAPHACSPSALAGSSVRARYARCVAIPRSPPRRTSSTAAHTARPPRAAQRAASTPPRRATRSRARGRARDRGQCASAGAEARPSPPPVGGGSGVIRAARRRRGPPAFGGGWGGGGWRSSISSGYSRDMGRGNIR